VNAQRAPRSCSISVPFSRLVLYHREIGTHRGSGIGFRDIFKFRTLRDVPFTHLASKVKDAYEGRSVPPRAEWHALRESLHWLVEKKRDGVYALDAKLLVRHSPFQSYYLWDGHHRALALFILGETEIKAEIDR
jgi:hypothetical protein